MLTSSARQNVWPMSRKTQEAWEKLARLTRVRWMILPNGGQVFEGAMARRNHSWVEFAGKARQCLDECNGKSALCWQSLLQHH